MPSATYTGFRAAVEAGNTTCLAETEAFLARAEALADLNIYLELFAAEALEAARAADRAFAEGRARRLEGLVLALKDNICYAGHHCSASSKILDGFRSLYTATCLQRLIDEGAIVIGRTNCDEFAMGSSNENSAFGGVKNPLNPGKVAGGSSGGSAAAVAAGTCHASLGTDTGGSVRQPASFCGNIGFRPSYGRVSRYGLIAFASSMDQVGTFTNNVEDAALLLQTMSGADACDATTSTRPVPEFADMRYPQRPMRVAFMESCINHEGVAPRLRDAFRQLKADLVEEGHEVTDVDFPYLDQMIPVYYTLAAAEASSNLERYAGLHYGYRAEGGTNLEDMIARSRSEGFGTEVKRRIMLGTFVLSEVYYEAYYDKAQKVRQVIRKHTEKLLDDADVLILPTSPGTAFGFGQKTQDPISMYLADIFTIQSPLAGIPAASVPYGTGEDGMPFGIQVMAKAFEEEKILAFAQYIGTKTVIRT